MNPKRAAEPCSLELCQHMVLKPYQPTSASPSHPSMHCLDMHRSYLQDTLETHIGQSSHLACLIAEQ